MATPVATSGKFRQSICAVRFIPPNRYTRAASSESAGVLIIRRRSPWGRAATISNKAKKAVDEGIAKLRKKDGRSPMPPWKLHDLRRTVKTLMVQAGVRPDISERVLSHTIQDVEGVYDCYEYLAEKRDALEKLAVLVDRIVHPHANVTEFPASAASAG
jgi:integrase